MTQWRREQSSPRQNLASLSDETGWFTRIYFGETVAALVYGRTQEEAASRAKSIVTALGRNDAIPDAVLPSTVD